MGFGEVSPRFDQNRASDKPRREVLIALYRWRAKRVGQVERGAAALWLYSEAMFWSPDFQGPQAFAAFSPVVCTIFKWKDSGRCIILPISAMAALCVQQQFRQMEVRTARRRAGASCYGFCAARELFPAANAPDSRARLVGALWGNTGELLKCR